MDRAEKLKHYMAQFEDEGNVDIVVNPDGSTIRTSAKNKGGISPDCNKSSTIMARDGEQVYPVGDWRGFGLSGLFLDLVTGIKGLRATKKID